MSLSARELVGKMADLTERVGVSQELFKMARSALRYYKVDRPLSIGILSRQKRHEAFYDLMDNVEAVREKNNFSSEEAAILLLRLVLNDKRCFKAMEVFHEEWENEDGRTLPSPRSGIWIADIHPWMAHLGYDPFPEGDTPENNVFTRIDERAKSREAEGAEFAEECMEEVLRKGNVLRLSRVDAMFQEKYSYDPTSRSTGFMKRMIEFIDSGDVVNLSLDDGDTVFVHKDDLDDVLSRFSAPED